jgi:hypothetical protein
MRDSGVWVAASAGLAGDRETQCHGGDNLILHPVSSAIRNNRESYHCFRIQVKQVVVVLRV